MTSEDVLTMIMSHADQSTQARSARVCRTWFDPASRNLWASLDEVSRLFCLLQDQITDFEGKIIFYVRDSANIKH